MDFALSEDQRILRDEITRFAENELNDDIAERDRGQTFSREQWDKCAEMGLAGLPVPEQYGGSGLDGLTTAIALEALGYGCRDGGLVFSLCAHLLACTVPIWKHGSDELKERYLPGLCAGTTIAVNAMTETTSGSDAFNMACRAVKDGNGYRINGTKIMSTNGPIADIVITYSQTDPEKGAYGGLTGFVLDAKTEGIRTDQKFEKMGLRTSMLGEVVFEDAYAPEEAMIGKVGGGTAIFTQSMEWERTLIAAAHLGTMRRLLEDCIAYARTRVSGEHTIGKHQAVSHKIVDMKIRLEAARNLTYCSAWNLDRSRTSAMASSMTKVFVSEALVQTALDAVQIHGGHGFLTETGVERILRDSIGGTLYSGTNEVQRNIVAGWLGL